MHVKTLLLSLLLFVLKLQLLASFPKIEFQHSFYKEPFISPKIVCELSNGEKNLGNQIVAVNLMGAQGSNRYYGEINTEGSPWIYQESDDNVYEYRFIDQTKEGIYILHQRSKKNSTESFQSILLLEIKRDYGIFFDTKPGKDDGPNRVFSADWGVDLTDFTTRHGGPDRLLAIKLCEIPLANSWTGEISLKDNHLHISELGEFRFEPSFTFRKIYDYLETVWEKIFPKYDQARNSIQSLIHKKIVQDLHTWVMDIGDQVISIDMLASQNYEETESEQDESYYPPFFNYWHLGQTKNNIHIFRIEEGTGGRGIFPNVMMIAFEQDRGMYIDWKKKLIRRSQKRLLAKKLGEIPLPMFWWGSLQVEDNTLVIGDHEGVAVPLCYCENKKTAAILEFKKQDERIFCIAQKISD